MDELRLELQLAELRMAKAEKESNEYYKQYFSVLIIKSKIEKLESREV